MLIRKNRLWVLVCLVFLLSAASAEAQLAPTPKSAPRTPVKKQILSTSEPSLPSSRIVKGRAIVLDSERLKIDKIEVRLFGVVPPLLSASYGPQARGLVDSLARGTVTCRIRDRNKAGQLMASCQNEDKQDFGMELLRRGLAVTARGSLHSTDLALGYISAEEAAKAQNLGLWSITPPKPAIQTVEVAPPTPVIKPDIQPESPGEEQPVIALSGKDLSTPLAQEEPPQPASAPARLPPPSPSPIAGEAPTKALAAATTELSFVERYQVLLSAAFLFFAALLGAGAFLFVRWQERRDALRSLAAALRGELMAARSVCLARLAKIAHEQDDRATSWPRLRAMVFQAYLGQLGRLGAELARQISSIYGQAADYASYYIGTEGKAESASKQQALQTLVQHIEDVVPRLAQIERDGTPPLPPHTLRLTSLLGGSRAGFADKLKTSSPTPLPEQKPASSLPAPEDKTPSAAPQEAPQQEQETAQETPEAQTPAPKAAPEPVAAAEAPIKEQSAPVKEAPAKTTASPQRRREELRHAMRASARQEKKESPRPFSQKKSGPVRKPPLWENVKNIDLVTPLANSLAQLKLLATDQIEKLRPRTSSVIEDIIPDYANLTEEEIEALSFSDAYDFIDYEEEDRKVS